MTSLQTTHGHATSTQPVARLGESTSAHMATDWDNNLMPRWASSCILTDMTTQTTSISIGYARYEPFTGTGGANSSSRLRGTPMARRLALPAMLTGKGRDVTMSLMPCSYGGLILVSAVLSVDPLIIPLPLIPEPRKLSTTTHQARCRSPSPNLAQPRRRSQVDQRPGRVLSVLQTDLVCRA